jgi:drug/metabolite transporter (DMT)-like permease
MELLRFVRSLRHNWIAEHRTLAFGYNLLVHKGELGKLTIAALLNITGFQLCVAFGLLLVEARCGAVVAHTMPFWATIFAAIFLGERLTLTRCLG